MAKQTEPDLGAMLNSGWSIDGYSVCLMAMGATSHHILLRNGDQVQTLTIVINAGQEQGRELLSLAPPMPKKKGFFG